MDVGNEERIRKNTWYACVKSSNNKCNYFLKSKDVAGVKEMAQWIESFMLEHKDLSLVS